MEWLYAGIGFVFGVFVGGWLSWRLYLIGLQRLIREEVEKICHEEPEFKEEEIINGGKKYRTMWSKK